MKQLLSILVITACLASSYAQAPQGINYQAIARNPTTGAPMTNTNINIGFRIREGSATGTVLYDESYTSVSTGATGLFNLTVGKGLASVGTFSGIDWSSGPKFLEVLINGASGGTQQILSVPYALHAQTVEHNDDADADPANELQQLSQSGNTVTLSKGGGSVTFTTGVQGYSNTPSHDFGTGIIFSQIATVSFSVTDTSKIFIQADASMWGNGSICVGAILLNIDGMDEDRSLVMSDNPIAFSGNNKTSVATSWMKTVLPGSHTVVLKAGGWSGNCNIFQHPHLNVLVLGK